MQPILPADLELSRNTDRAWKCSCNYIAAYGVSDCIPSQDVYSIIPLHYRRHSVGKNKDSYIIFVTVLYARK